MGATAPAFCNLLGVPSLIKWLPLSNVEIVVASEYLLLLGWQAINQFTFLRTIALSLFHTIITANEKIMTDLIFAVMVCVTFRFLAEVTGSNYFITDSLSETFIEHEVLATELIRKPLFFNLALIVDNSTL